MTKKKSLLIPIIIVIAITCISCDKKEDIIEEPNYNIYKDIESNNSDKGLNPDIDYHEKDETVMSREWPYQLDYKGTGTDMIPLPFGNLDVNRKPNLQLYSYLVCPDKINDCIYYINYGKDNYIYQLKDGVSSLLITKETLYLQLWENELYFVENANTKENKYGEIYSYNLDTNELKLILDENAGALYVDAKGIFYLNYNLDDDPNVFNISGHRLDYGSTTSYKTDYFVYFPFEKYEIYNYKSEDVSIYNKETGERTFLAPIDYRNKLRVFGEYLTFSEKTCIYVLNLKTGEKAIYDINDCASLPTSVDYINDYIILEENIYLTSNVSNYIIIIELDTGKISSKMTNQGLSFDYLYACDKRLFSLVSEIDADDQKRLIELYLKDNQVITKELGE